MKGYEQFIEVFGGITVLDIATFAIAAIFAVMVYRRVRDYMIAQHEDRKQHDADLKEALAGVRKYPEYRQQSIEIQRTLQDEIAELRAQQQENTKKLIEMEKRRQRQKRNELRDTLLRNFRYYTNKHTNPEQTWTRVESETFWELYKDYESEGGNGYMHTDVAPVMRLLTVVDE